MFHNKNAKLTKKELLKLENLSKIIRIKCLDLNFKSQTSHLGSCFSIIEILNILYFKILYLRPKNINFKNRDRFILSKGHACLALYVVLAEKKFFSYDNLMNYGKNNSDFMAHVSHKISGVEFSTGSLGHGLPFAVGKAYYAKKFNKKWKTFCLLSDGELNEGSNWEALIFASHYHLNNLTIIIDSNKWQSIGKTKDVLDIEPIDRKLKNFKLNVLSINGHDYHELTSAFISKSSKYSKVIIANTIKGKGVSFMEDTLEWHYKSLNENELKKAVKEINQ